MVLLPALTSLIRALLPCLKIHRRWNAEWVLLDAVKLVFESTGEILSDGLVLLGQDQKCLLNQIYGWTLVVNYQLEPISRPEK